MEKDQQTTFGDGVVIKEDAVAGAASATSTTQGEEAAASKVVVNGRKTFASEEQIKAVFSNRLIAHNIVSYLNHADMKAARQVSQTFLEMVETSKRFREAKVLRVTKGKCSVGELNRLVDSDRIWRGIRIDIPFWPENLLLNHVSRFFKNIEFVSLRFDIDTCVDPKDIDMKAFWSIVSFIRDVLSSARNIKHLQIGTVLFDMNLRSVFECSDVRENLKTLQRLDITDKEDLDCTDNINIKVSRHKFLDWHLKSWPVHFKKCLTNNLVLLRTILQRLQSFDMANENLKYCAPCDTNPLQSAVVELLEGNRFTLKELSTHWIAWDDHGVSGVTFPRLRSLTAATSRLRFLVAATLKTEGEDEDKLKDFVANHQTLEELDVHVEDSFVTSVFGVIRFASLRKLHLTADTSDGSKEVYIDWRFLGEMSRLTDFQFVWRFILHLNRKNYGNGTRILQSLPQNQLERLSLSGIGASDFRFWSFTEFMGDYIDLELSSKLELLGKFRNLKHLSLRQCPDAVDDDIMRFISREMTSLQKLEVSCCPRLTDAGIAGTSEDGSDSIRNLKGLQKLSIAYCRLVTPDGLLSCLRLQFLQHFEYKALDKVKVTKSFVLKIMSQNPSLESISVNLDCPESEVLEEANNPRLTKLINTGRTESDVDTDYDYNSDEESSFSDSEDDSDNVNDDISESD